jgi:hypothetical protein
VGHFDNPGTDVIGETLVLHPAGGCISTVSATRGTYSESNYQLFRSVIDSLCSHPELSVGDALWQSKLALSGSYSSNNKFYVMLGYPDMPLPLPLSGGTVTVEGDTLRSGELNTVSGQGFQEQGLAFVRVLESARDMVYTCLGGAQITYSKYGGTAYSGTQTVDDGRFSLDCFIPVQSYRGPSSRAGVFSLSGLSSLAGAEDPLVLVEGTPSSGDLQGPEVDMWIRGYEGIEIPQLTGDVTLEAQLTDSSGICLLGGSGKELNLFIDGSGNDVGPYFSYDRGSSVSGRLEYGMEALALERGRPGEQFPRYSRDPYPPGKRSVHNRGHSLSQSRYRDALLQLQGIRGCPGDRFHLYGGRHQDRGALRHVHPGIQPDTVGRPGSRRRPGCYRTVHLQD